MSGDTTSDDEGSQEDPPRYDIDDLEIIKTIGTGTFGRVVLCRHHGTPLALKILSMVDVIRLKQVEHLRNEITILKEVKHPFIVNMLWSGRDEARVYMLLEFVAGGELFSYLRAAGRFAGPTSCFYAAEIVCALDYLHSKHIVYRDLKPENLLLDSQGHLKITDFGFSKKLTDRTWTLCGTPEYLAPEIIQSKGHNKAVDWWALGVLIYEMLAGYPPFFDDNPFGIYEKILSGRIEWPKHVDPIAKDLIKKLLIADRTKRLGNMRQGAEDVKRHRWFKLVEWPLLCDWEDFSCLYENANNIRIIENVVRENLTCECLVPCRSISYDLQSLTLPLNGDHDFNPKLYHNLSKAQSVLKVFMKSATFIEMDTIPAADELYLLSSLGGIFNLFLGCSFISVLEIFYYIGLALHAKFKKSK